MAITFGGATSDRLTLQVQSASNNLNPFTWTFWAFCTTRNSSRVIIAKNSTSQKMARLNGSTGNVELLVGRATTGADYITSDTPLAANTWKYFAFTFDSTAAAGSLIHIYSGSLTSSIVESTYGTKTDGSGAVSTDSSQGFVIGNNSGALSAFQGRIANFSVWNRILTTGELIDQQFNPHMETGCVLFTPLFDTSLLVDYSGHLIASNFTLTGGASGSHVPIPPLFN